MLCVIFSDDLTGGGNIGVEFSRVGLQTDVIQHDALGGANDTDVLIINTDSRYCTADEAVSRIRTAWQHVSPKAPNLWVKKIDSLLRGNIGVEIDALMQASGQRRCLLLVASPKLKRTTVGGYQLFEGIPINQLPQLDPTSKVATAHIPTLLTGQSVNTIHLYTENDVNSFQQEGIFIADAAQAAKMRDIVADAYAAGIRCFAGTYGLGEMLTPFILSKPRPVLVLAGSLSHVCRRQVEDLHATSSASRVPLNGDAAMTTAHLRQIFADGKHPFLYTGDLGDTVKDIETYLAASLRPVLEMFGGFVATGGATAQWLLQELGGDGLHLHPVEVFPGTALASIASGLHINKPFLLKPGAQGDEYALRTLLEYAIMMQRTNDR